jgi:hypothetical protein
LRRLASTCVLAALSIGAFPSTPVAQGDGVGPTIDVLHGLSQQFGQNGHPQRWVNILGHVEDVDGVATLTWALNGGVAIPLNIGSDERRLYDPGEFNAEIDIALLNDGINTVRLDATDVFGSASSVTVQLDFTAAPVVARTTTVDWSTAIEPQELAWIVDGEWAITPDGIRTTQLGYDRVFGIGDLSWDDYEVTVDFVFHGLDPDPINTSISGTPAFGLTTRWIGHSRRSTIEQPRTN